MQVVVNDGLLKAGGDPCSLEQRAQIRVYGLCQISWFHVAHRRQGINRRFHVNRSCRAIFNPSKRGISFGEKAIRGERGNQVTPSVIAEHRGIDREIAAQINGAAGLRLGACEPVKDDLALLTV
jgi:hypothetical protein